MIFFRSHSVIAENPAMNIVNEAIIRSDGWNNFKDIRRGENRIRRKTPAVTRVEE